MNKTVLGIMGFLLLAPGLVLLGTGGIIVGFLMCVTGTGLLTLAIRPRNCCHIVFRGSCRIYYASF